MHSYYPYEVLIQLLNRLFMADYKALAELPLDPENGGVFYAPQVRGIFHSRL